MNLRIETRNQNKQDEIGVNSKGQNKDARNRLKDRGSHSKNNSVSQQHDSSKNKYETASSQQEFLLKNMEKYKQIFDSNFLTEEEQQQKQSNQQQQGYNGSSSLPTFPENQSTLTNQNEQKNTGRNPQFKYNSFGNLSPAKKNEISIIQPPNNQNQQSYIQMNSNNDLSTTFIPKNIFEDMFTSTNTNGNEKVTQTTNKNKKVSSTKLEPIQQLSFHRENELADDQLRVKTRNAQQLLSQQKKLQLNNIKLNQDISYFKEQKELRYSTHVDTSTVTNTYIMKNPASLFHSSSEQKKGNVYVQMFDYSHNKEKFDTDLASIQQKIGLDELKKSASQQNMNSQNISSILSQTGAKILDSKKPSQQNLTQNPINLSTNSGDQKAILLKRSSMDVNTHRQLQPISQNNSIFQNGQIFQSQQQFRPNKEVLFYKPTNRNEVIELESWLTEMIDKVELNETMNMKDVYDQIQVIYVACMKELIRQITIQCKDRGRLLQKVWDSYLDLLSRGMQQTHNVKSGEEKEHLDEVTRIHKMYDQTIKLIETELEKKKKESKEQAKSQEQLTDAIHYFRKKLKTYEIEIKKMQQIEEELRFELEAALSENLKLKLIQGDSKSHEESHAQTVKNSNQNSLLNAGDEPQQQKQDIQIIKSFQNINIDNTNSKKGTMTNIKIGEKKNKVSVVSHLINYNKKGMVEDEEDEKKKKDLITQFKIQMQERDNMSEDSDVFGEKGEEQNRNKQKMDELDFLMEEEKKLAELKIPDIELFDIAEVGVQTDEIKFSENEQINFLIKQLSQNEIFSEAEPDLIKKYTESYSIVRQSGMDISQKETVLAALDQCKLQVVAYQKLSSVNGIIAIENTELKAKALDLGIQLKEVEQNYQDKKRKWKKRALTYIEKIQEKDEIISQLEDNSNKMEEKLIKNIKQKQMVSAVIGKLLKKSTLPNSQNENTIQENSQEYIQTQQMNTEESNEEKMDHLDLIESMEIEKQQTSSSQLPIPPNTVARVLSQFVGDDINHQNVEQKSRDDLNKILLKLGGKNLFSSTKDVDSPTLRGRKAKGSLLESKKISSSIKQTKRVYSQNTNQATHILDGILKKKNSIKNAVVPLASIQKFFTIVYFEILKNEQGHRVPLHVSCYDLLIQKHGLKRVAEDKLARILKSVYIYKDKNIKMEMVATFLGLNQKYDEIDYYYFLLGLKYFQNVNQNILNLNNEHGQINCDKALDFVNTYFSDKLEKEGYAKLQTDIKMSSSQKGIEFEMLLKKCLFYYLERKEKTKKHIEDVFYATDLDANDQIELYEFDLIFRYIEKKIYDSDQVEEMFFEEADNINPANGEKALSLNKFVNLCVQKNLFSLEKCQAFQEQTKEVGLAQNFNELKENASEYKKQIKNRFLKAGKFMLEIKQIIKSLFKLINDPAPQRPTSLWVSYILMEKESRRLLLEYEANSLLQSLLPLKLQMLDIVAKRFEEII